MSTQVIVSSYGFPSNSLKRSSTTSSNRSSFGKSTFRKRMMPRWSMT